MKRKLLLIFGLIVVTVVSLALLYPGETREAVDTSKRAYTAVFQVIDVVDSQKPAKHNNQ